MTTDLDYITGVCESMGIPVFPRLAAAEFDKKINVNYSDRFPGYAGWTETQKEKFHEICGPVNQALGYEYDRIRPREDAETCHVCNIKSCVFKLRDMVRELYDSAVDRLTGSRHLNGRLQIDFHDNSHKYYSTEGCRTNAVTDGIELLPEGGKNAYLLLGGGRWTSIDKDQGWKSEAGHYYRGVLNVEIGSGDSAEMFCLMYNTSGKLISKKSLGRIQRRTVPLSFSFKVRGDARRFNMAVYMSKAKLPDKMKLISFSLEKVRLNH